MVFYLTKNGKIQIKEWWSGPKIYKFCSIEEKIFKIFKIRSDSIESIREYCSRFIRANLDCSIELEKGFTLRTYFNLVRNYPALQDCDLWFSDYFREFDLCPTNNCRTDDFDYLVLDRFVSYRNYDVPYIDPKKRGNHYILEDDGSTKPCNFFDNFRKELNDKKLKFVSKEKKTIDYGWQFHAHGFPGVSDDSEYNFIGPNDRITWSLSGTQLENLLDHEIKIGEFMIQVPAILDGGLRFESKTFSIDNTHINLFDFIKTIIFELSFFGGPENRDKTFEELKESVAVLKTKIKDE